MLKSLVARATRPVPLGIVTVSDYPSWLENQPPSTRRWLKDTAFEAASGRTALLPGTRGELVGALAIISAQATLWDYSRLPRALPARVFALSSAPDPSQGTMIALGWAFGTYVFDRYKKSDTEFARLVWPSSVDRNAVARLVEGVGLGRERINTPANDMGPEELTRAGRELARRHGATFKVTVGEQLLKANYPAIHAVGRASSRAPRLFDIRWGNPRHPKVTLVGKGVCFDSGGLDIKPAPNMLLMKKDMGGAATVLGLAHAVMAAKLALRLRVLIPAVENSVSGDAFRPLDVLRTRKGLTVEVGNTDAEGRLILCDALAEADAENPELIIDVATLTGAARVALGTKLPALFCTSGDWARSLLDAGRRVQDPLWRLPIYGPYKKLLASHVADINNVSNGPFAGAITAALFLREFVSKERNYIHIDTMAYNTSSSPGRPVGGEAMGLRALAELLAERYPQPTPKPRKKARRT